MEQDKPLVIDTPEAIRAFSRLSVIGTLRLMTKGIKFKRNTLKNIRAAYGLRSWSAAKCLEELENQK